MIMAKREKVTVINFMGASGKKRVKKVSTINIDVAYMLEQAKVYGEGYAKHEGAMYQGAIQHILNTNL